MTLLSRIYAFGFFWMFLVIIPVMVPFFQSLGLSMENIFQLQAIFGVGVMLFEVPTGYLCDYFGRKKVLVTGAILNGIGFTLLFGAKTFLELAGFEVILAAGASLVSGADLSLIYDAIEVEGGSRTHKTHAIANLQMSQVSGEATASILGGLLAALSFRHVLLANLLTSWIPLLIALSFKAPPYKRIKGGNHFKNLARVIRHVLRGDPFLRVIFLNLLCWGLSTFFAVWIFQKYWQQQGIALGWFGAIWAGFNISVGIIGKQVHRIEKRFGAKPLLIFLALAPVAGYFGMAALSGWVGVLVGILFYLSRGITHVLLREAYNARIPSEFRATANSLIAGCFRLVFAIFGPLVGFVIDRSGITTALVGLGVVFGGLLLVLMPAMLRGHLSKHG